MIILYHSPGARSMRCAWALEELGVGYELRVMPFPPRIHAPQFLQINPLGSVPFMQDGEIAMRESGAILEYLAARHDPAGLLGVAVADPGYGDWLDWIHFGEATLTTPLATVFRYSIVLPEAERISAVVDDFSQIFLSRLEAVEQRLVGREFLCAERFTAADIAVGYALYLGNYLGLGGRFGPAASAYLARLLPRPAFKRARQRERVGASSPGGVA